MTNQFDDAIVGAGIMGLAHAYTLAARGRRVIVFERSPRAMGASVRNFGMIWPIGQPAGTPLSVALASRGIWLEVLAESRLWHEQTGSLHLVYHETEAAVLREFIAAAQGAGYRCEWLDAAQVVSQSTCVNPAGLTLCHYKSFQDCPSLPALRERFDREMADYARYRIHVMASQHARGEITIGDSHVYGDEITPFDRGEINELILAYLRTFLIIPDLRISERWNGVYAAHEDELCWTDNPAPGATIVASPGGRGMTMSFGIAQRTVNRILGEN